MASSDGGRHARANRNADEGLTMGKAGLFALAMILFWFVVFFLPRWIRTILAVVAFVYALLIICAAELNIGKTGTFFRQFHSGVIRLSTSLVKDIDCGKTAQVKVVLEQLANQSTNVTDHQYNRFVWDLVADQEGANRAATATTNNLTASPNQTRY